MRRAIGALVLFVALAGSAAGCSGGDRAPDNQAAPSAQATTGGPTPAGSDGTQPGPGTSTGTPPGTGTQGSLAPIPTAKAGGNAAAICAGARKASETGTTAYIDQLSTLLQAEAGNDTAGANTARTTLEKALDTWSARMRQLAGDADDAQLRTVLTELSAEVDKMEASIESVDDGRLGNIQDRLDALCPS